MAQRETIIWEFHARLHALALRDGRIDTEEARLLRDLEGFAQAQAAGLALIRTGAVPERAYEQRHPWLVRLLATMGPGRIVACLDIPLPAGQTHKAA